MTTIGPINDPINDQTGNAPNAPSATNHEGNAHSVPEGETNAAGLNSASIIRSEDIAQCASSHNTNVMHNTRPRNGPLFHPTIFSPLSRAESMGIGRFRIDTERLINNLNLDLSVPHNRMQQVPLPANDPMQEPSYVIPVQMNRQTYFDALMRMLMALGATKTEAAR
jgi:hypothetical protein